MDYTELCIGCGSRLSKDLCRQGYEGWHKLTRLDINDNHSPEVVWDLNNHPLPFDDSAFDEIHAYDVLEHIGRQGDYRAFFAEFSEYWRILKPGGRMFATVPMWNNAWAWGDPSHTRVIQLETLVYLDQSHYAQQVGKTRMSDFRYLYSADFRTVFHAEAEGKLSFVLLAMK